MKIAFLGAGAVGLSVAGMLSRVCDVYAVCRKRHSDAIQSRGLILTGIWGEHNFRFPCGETLPPDEKFDYIFITSKSQDTREICRTNSEAIKNSNVISLQNGIGNEEIISEFTDRVIGGMIITGFEWKGDGEVHVSVQAAPMRLGRFPSGLDDDVNSLADIIQKAGIDVITDENIRGALWGKTLYNCALNPIGAIMQVPYGELLNENAWAVIKNIVHEAFEVCRAEGVTLEWSSPDEYLQYLHDKQIPSTAEHHSSMYQDISAGKKTEIDFINGAVVEKGNLHNIETPVNRTIVNMIKFRESLNK
ncbi:ketopantoate reductase family protein [Methanolacinia paynteri]|uniref:ketopantoate reductase family protein n=1 Tax=Methanolacinia paynteri TaxID=230356 RepID=UPI00064FD8A4|nr:2-dehydropantoate 2-reductase [Methanolacinia paynteri]